MFEIYPPEDSPYDDPASRLESKINDDVIPYHACVLERHDLTELNYNVTHDRATVGRLCVEVARHTFFDVVDELKPVGELSQSMVLRALDDDVKIFDAYFGANDDPVISMNTTFLEVLRPEFLEQQKAISDTFTAAFKLLQEAQANGRIVSNLEKDSETVRMLMWDIATALNSLPPNTINFTHSTEIYSSLFEIDSSYRNTGEIFRKVRPAGLARDLYPVIRTLDGQTSVLKPSDSALADSIIKKCLKIFSRED